MSQSPYRLAVRELDSLFGDLVSDRADEAIDQLEALMAEHPCQAQCPLRHRFTPGLYIREILIPRGTRLTSRIHKYEHPFVISKGAISVWTKRTGWEYFKAPHTGITKPGTRRVLYAHEDTIWTTFHLNPNEERDPEKIVNEVTDVRITPAYLAAVKRRELLK
jgi:hypothetical protein